MKTLTSYLTLIDTIIPKKGLLWDTAWVLGFSCFTALCAQISFWIGPVPVSGQTFGVLLSGALLGSRRGALSQFSYLAIGATGIPYWFAFGGALGIARLMGTTGGYLFGFVVAAFVIGWLAERGWDRHIWTSILAMLSGSVVIYIFGLSWLAFFMPKDTLLQIGLYPFILGDLLKLLLAAFMLPSSWLLLHRFAG
jgi:biotin transporter BioY